MTGQDSEEHDPAPAGMATRSRRGKDGEPRLPPLLAVVIAVVLYAALPESLLVGPRYLIPAIEVLLVVALTVTNPWRLTRQTRWSRITSLGLAGLVVLSNLVTLVMLVHILVSAADAKGSSLLIAALQVWLTNVIAFTLIYWELDRGGPVARTQTERDKLPLADFRFTQDETQDTVIEVAAGSSKTASWIPTFVDYLYLSTTNSSAFSPTDTMPLSSRAKILMGIEATAALITSLLVIARAVGSLGGGQ